jgi:hypothetical protein
MVKGVFEIIKIFMEENRKQTLINYCMRGFFRGEYYDRKDGLRRDLGTSSRGGVQ